MHITMKRVQSFKFFQAHHKRLICTREGAKIVLLTFSVTISAPREFYRMEYLSEQIKERLKKQSIELALSVYYTQTGPLINYTVTQKAPSLNDNAPTALHASDLTHLRRGMGYHGTAFSFLQKLTTIVVLGSGIQRCGLVFKTIIIF